MYVLKWKHTIGIVYIILLFHIFRNLRQDLYVVLLLSFYILAFLMLIIGFKICIPKIKILQFFYATWIWVPIISLFYMPVNEYVISFSRYLIVFLFFSLLVFGYKNISLSIIYKFLYIYCIYCVLAACSLFWQIAFGAISFFADASERAGVVRYSTLCGSLTVFGSAGAFALAILLFHPKIKMSNLVKSISIAIITIGMAATMQKAAIINLLIVYVFFLAFKIKNLSIRNVLILIASFLLALIIWENVKDTSLGQYSIKNFQYTLGNDGVKATTDLKERWESLPVLAIERNGITGLNMLIGKGFLTLAGTLGLPKYQMNHNNFCDYWFSGGILHLIAFLFIYIQMGKCAIINMFQKKLQNENRTIIVVIALLFANMSAGSFSIYQPVCGSIICIFIIYHFKLQESLRKEKI